MVRSLGYNMRMSSNGRLPTFISSLRFLSYRISSRVCYKHSICGISILHESHIPQSLHRGVSSVLSLLMINKSWLPKESFLTFIASTGPLSCVSSLVTDESWQSSKCFLTITAFIWFLSCMNSLVYGKIGFSRESFITCTAFEGFLTWVGSLMYESWLRGQNLPTLTTFMGLSYCVMSFLMISESWLLDESLWAFTAAIWSLSCVNSLMYTETCPNHEGFITDSASERSPSWMSSLM